MRISRLVAIGVLALFMGASTLTATTTTGTVATHEEMVAEAEHTAAPLLNTTTTARATAPPVNYQVGQNSWPANSSATDAATRDHDAMTVHNGGSESSEHDTAGARQAAPTPATAEAAALPDSGRTRVHGRAAANAPPDDNSVLMRSVHAVLMRTPSNTRRLN